MTTQAIDSALSHIVNVENGALSLAEAEEILRVTRAEIQDLSDAGLATVAKIVFETRQRLENLLIARDDGFREDHDWISGIALNCLDELCRRLRAQGIPARMAESPDGGF